MTKYVVKSVRRRFYKTGRLGDYTEPGIFEDDDYSGARYVYEQEVKFLDKCRDRFANRDGLFEDANVEVVLYSVTTDDTGKEITEILMKEEL